MNRSLTSNSHQMLDTAPISISVSLYSQPSVHSAAQLVVRAGVDCAICINRSVSVLRRQGHVMPLSVCIYILFLYFLVRFACTALMFLLLMQLFFSLY